MIEVQNLTIKYPNGKGVFDLNFKVKKGEAFGYIGPKGAGKTTTIGALMGFNRPTKGSVAINDLNAYKNAARIHKNLGYVPREVVFFEGMRIKSYLKFMIYLRGIKPADVDGKKNELLERFELDTNDKLDRLKLEDRKKLAIVNAFLHEPEVLIMDEPFLNLNPAMQTRLVDLVIEEKRKGRSFILTSKLFSEVERTCDRVGLLRDGYLIEKDDVIGLKSKELKSYLIKFAEPPNLGQLKKYGFKYKAINARDFEIYTPGDQIDLLIKILSHEKILVLNSNTQILEEIFLDLYYHSKEVKV